MAPNKATKNTSSLFHSHKADEQNISPDHFTDFCSPDDYLYSPPRVPPKTHNPSLFKGNFLKTIIWKGQLLEGGKHLHWTGLLGDKCRLLRIRFPRRLFCLQLHSAAVRKEGGGVYLEGPAWGIRKIFHVWLFQEMVSGTPGQLSRPSPLVYFGLHSKPQLSEDSAANYKEFQHHAKAKKLENGCPSAMSNMSASAFYRGFLA